MLFELEVGLGVGIPLFLPVIFTVTFFAIKKFRKKHQNLGVSLEDGSSAVNNPEWEIDYHEIDFKQEIGQ